MPLSRKEIAEKIANCQSPGCTRVGWSADSNSLGRCVGWHCALCGEPCSSHGHLDCPERPTELLAVKQQPTIEMDTAPMDLSYTMKTLNDKIDKLESELAARDKEIEVLEDERDEILYEYDELQQRAGFSYEEGYAVGWAAAKDEHA